MKTEENVVVKNTSEGIAYGLSLLSERLQIRGDMKDFGEVQFIGRANEDGAEHVFINIRYTLKESNIR